MGYTQRRRVEVQVARELVLALSLLAAAMIQTALLPRPLGVTLNLVLLLTLCHALIAGPSRSARWALYGGVGLDLCAATLLGTHALALLAAALSTLTLVWLSRGNWLLPLLAALVGSLSYHAVLALAGTLLVARVDPQAYLLVAVVPDTLGTLVAVLPTYMFMRWLAGWRRGEVPIDVY